MAKDLEKKSKKEKKHFFKDFKAELKKVIWPTPKQVVNNTVAVITIVLITAVIVFALDFVFKAINTYGIDGIRGIVSSNTTTDSESETSQEGTEQNDTVEGTVDENTQTEGEETTETVTDTETTEVQNPEEAENSGEEQ